MLEYFFPWLRHDHSLVKGMLEYSPCWICLQAFAPTIPRKGIRRYLTLEVDADGFTAIGPGAKRIHLERAQVVEAQTTLTGSIWLVTRIPGARIVVPADLPNLKEFVETLRNENVPLMPRSRWVETFLLPLLLLSFCGAAALIALAQSTHAWAIVASVVTLLVLFWMAARQETREPGKPIKGVTLVLASLMGFKVISEAVSRLWR